MSESTNTNPRVFKKKKKKKKDIFKVSNDHLYSRKLLKKTVVSVTSIHEYINHITIMVSLECETKIKYYTKTIIIIAIQGTFQFLYTVFFFFQKLQ